MTKVKKNSFSFASAEPLHYIHTIIYQIQDDCI